MQFTPLLNVSRAAQDYGCRCRAPPLVPDRAAPPPPPDDPESAAGAGAALGAALRGAAVGGTR
jgi:hypothetical protein